MKCLTPSPFVPKWGQNTAVGLKGLKAKPPTAAGDILFFTQKKFPVKTAHPHYK